MLHSVFVYGSLRDPDVLMKLLRRVPPMKPARVHDYRKYFDQELGYTMAIHEKGSFIDGSLLHGIGNRELSMLDSYEGVRSGPYRRVTVQAVPAGSKAPVEAFMYVKGGEIQ